MSIKQRRYWSAKRGEGEAMKWLRDNADYQGDECLTWPFSIVRGYGNFGYLGKILYAHRYMCELVNGPPPSPLHQAAHECGNGDRGCVNPRHLSWKTNGENQLDRTEHGRRNLSYGRHGSKLTPDQVEAIRSLRGKKTQDEIALMFGTSRRNIGAILSGKTWARPRTPIKIFTDGELIAIMGDNGNYREIASKYGSSPGVIWRIKKGQYSRPKRPELSSDN